MEISGLPVVHACFSICSFWTFSWKLCTWSSTWSVWFPASHMATATCCTFFFLLGKGVQDYRTKIVVKLEVVYHISNQKQMMRFRSSVCTVTAVWCFKYRFSFDLSSLLHSFWFWTCIHSDTVTYFVTWAFSQWALAALLSYNLPECLASLVLNMTKRWQWQLSVWQAGILGRDKAMST